MLKIKIIKYRNRFSFKILASFTSLLLYALIVFDVIGDFSYLFKREYFGYQGVFGPDERHHSQLLFVSVCWIYLLLMNWQHEYMHRLDYQWKRQLKAEQEQAINVKIVNKTLLQNILPHHVADVYLSEGRDPGKVYSELYTNVAVMFASIPNYLDFYTEAELNEGGVTCLMILNEIISAFDELLSQEEFLNVEKIKIIGSTYMAACGLSPGRKGSTDDLQDDESDEEHHVEDNTANPTTMAKFAAAMMRELNSLPLDKYEMQSINEYEPKFRLRVGVYSGPVIAGVVGAQKPLYDIWSNTVNIASRMDSTGVPGFIQLPEETAASLRANNVSCSYRDTIAVKGVKEGMRTYFVDLDEDLHIVPVTSDAENAEEVRMEKQMYRLRRDLNHSKIVRKKETPTISVEEATPGPSRPLTPTPSMASGLNMIIDSKDDAARQTTKMRAAPKRPLEKSNSRFLVTQLAMDVADSGEEELAKGRESGSSIEDHSGGGGSVITLDRLDIHRGEREEAAPEVNPFVWPKPSPQPSGEDRSDTTSEEEESDEEFFDTVEAADMDDDDGSGSVASTMVPTEPSETSR